MAAPLDAPLSWSTMTPRERAAAMTLRALLTTDPDEQRAYITLAHTYLATERVSPPIRKG